MLCTMKVSHRLHFHCSIILSTSVLYHQGFTITDRNPDYVVVGETHQYNYEVINKAINLVREGSRLIGTNCDVVDRAANGGVSPACASLMAPIVLVPPIFIFPRTPLMMR